MLLEYLDLEIHGRELMRLNLEARFSMLMDLKEQMSSLVIIPILSKPPLQCLLEALILTLALKQVQEGDDERGREKCYRTLPEI